MKKRHLFLLLFLFSCTKKSSNINELASIQIIDRNGLSETISEEDKLKRFSNLDFHKPQPYQQVLQVFKQDNGKTPSKIYSYHPNGNLHQELEIKNARANGLYKEFYPNGNIKIFANVIGGPANFQSQNEWIFNGKCSAWDEDGNQLSEFHYQDGFLNGNSFYYYPCGQIQKIVPYKKHQIHGTLITYFNNGKIRSQSFFSNGIREKESLAFFSNGLLAYKEIYENNLLQEAVYYNDKGSLISSVQNGYGTATIQQDEQNLLSVEYKEGKPEGKIKEISNHHLHHLYHQINQEKNGEEIFYYLSEKPKLLITWKNNEIDGMVKTWYENGVLESQKEFQKNKKNGLFYSWYKSGDLMFLEEYEDDYLKKGAYYKKGEKEPISTVQKFFGIATLYNADGSFLKKIRYQRGLPIE